MRYPLWYHTFLQLKTWHRYALLLLTQVLALLLWLLVAYLPLRKAIADLRIKQAHYALQQTTHIDTLQACKQLNEVISQSEDELASYCMHVDEQLQAPIALLMQTFATSGVQLTSLKKEQARDKEWYCSVPVRIQAMGTLQAIIGWFALLQEQQQLVQCKKTLIERQSNGEYMLHATLMFFVPKKMAEKISPSTLGKS